MPYKRTQEKIPRVVRAEVKVLDEKIDRLHLEKLM